MSTPLPSSASRPVVRRLGGVTVVLLLLAMAVLHLWSLGRYPGPFIDEAWFASRAWAYAETGRAFGPLDAGGAFERFAGHHTFFPFVPTWLQAQVLRLAGGPHLLALRALSLTFGAALLAAVYVIAARAGGRRAGLLSVVFVALSNTFFVGAHFARPDVMASALGFWAIALCFPVTGPAWRSCAAGVLVGVAFEIHPHSVVLGLAVGLLHVWKTPRCLRGLLALAAGCAFGFGLYFILHVVRHPGEFLAWNRIAFGPTHTPPLLAGTTALARSLREMGEMIMARSPLLGPIGAASLLVAAWRGSADDGIRKLASGALAALAGAILLWRNKPPYYAIYVMPLLEMAAALTLAAWLRSGGERRASLIGAGIIVTGFFATVVLVLQPLGRDGRDAYHECTRKLRAAIRPGDRILGVQTYWFALHDHPYRSWEQLVYLRRATPGSSLEDAFRQLRPDVFVVDAGLASFITDEPSGNAQREHLRLRPAEIRQVLSRHGTGETTFDCPVYGPFTVHRLAW